jgi:hypothetical protein
MAEASTKKQKKRLRQAADFPPPKQLSQEQVSEICATLRISDRHTVQIKDFLDHLVDEIDWMSREEMANRQGDRVRIINMRDYIAAAQYEFTKAKGLGIDGRLAVRSAAARLADILSGNWLRYHFPGDGPSRPMRAVRRSPREPNGDETYPNYQFIQHRAPETLNALLRDLESALASALTSLDSQPGARGGQQPLTYRHTVLVNLCKIWDRIGEKVVTTPKSKFVAFCHYIVEAMGWPTRGLVAAISRATTDWRNLHNRP